MPRSKRNRSKKMRGGLFGLFEGDSSSGASSGEGWFDKMKKSASGATSSSWFSSTPEQSQPQSQSYAQPQSQSYAPQQGGRRRRKHYRGGYSANSGNSSLANNAGSYSGATARAHSHVGGTRKCCRKHKKRCHRH
jgi:hypothetical protein